MSFFAFLLRSYGQNNPIVKKSADSGHVKIDSLKAAIVTAVIRPRMRRDTVEYLTGNVKLQSHAVIEDLLKRLPGLQVDADGTITYNREKIKHLLVDGEDIFGSDPTLVTRNFDAIKIARVQILERKSDQSIFTGIDDGMRTKTINLVLKASERNGYFGKAEAGGNLVGDYSLSAAIAGFRNKEQITALGFAANIGTLGFSNTANGTSISSLNGNSDALGASAGSGIPKFEASAMHYANTWSESRQHLTANYQFSHYYTEPTTSVETIQIEPDSIYGQNQLSHSVNARNQHWFYGIYDWTCNKLSAIKVKASPKTVAI